MLVASKSLNSTFRIGLDSSVQVLKIVVNFKHDGKGYIIIRPIYVWVLRNKSNQHSYE